MTMNSSGAILDWGGKRSATPLSDRTNSGVTVHLPPQSKSVHWQSLIGFRSSPPVFGEKVTLTTNQLYTFSFDLPAYVVIITTRLWSVFMVKFGCGTERKGGCRLLGAHETIDFQNTKTSRDGQKWRRFGPSNTPGQALHRRTTASAQGSCGFGYP